jgi:hypothetical protein
MAGKVSHSLKICNGNKNGAVPSMGSRATSEAVQRCSSTKSAYLRFRVVLGPLLMPEQISHVHNRAEVKPHSSP